MKYENKSVEVGKKKDAVWTNVGYGFGETAWGLALVAANDRGVCSVMLGDDPGTLRETLQSRYPKAELKPFESYDEDLRVEHPWSRLARAVFDFLASPDRKLDVPLDLEGTDFQRQVWQALRQIRVGETATYAEIARLIGRPTAVRGVAQACASNRLAVVIPCHRVIRSDGGLSGYRWGVERKRALLEWEKNQSGSKPDTRQLRIF